MLTMPIRVKNKNTRKGRRVVSYLLKKLSQFYKEIREKPEPNVGIASPGIRWHIGIIWQEGQKRKEKVFVKKSEYLIYFADNLEAEPENTFCFSQRIDYDYP